MSAASPRGSDIPTDLGQQISASLTYTWWPRAPMIHICPSAVVTSCEHYTMSHMTNHYGEYDRTNFVMRGRGLSTWWASQTDLIKLIQFSNDSSSSMRSFIAFFIHLFTMTSPWWIFTMVIFRPVIIWFKFARWLVSFQ